ncbi:20385_t:CDS:1, partial [Racocetra persica]
NALSMAKSVRDQLRELMAKHDLPLISCRLKNYQVKDDGDRHKKKRRNSYQDIKYNAEKILESFSTSYYINLAKRHPHRPVFYHYASATGPGSESIDSNSSLLALHISPTSALHPDNKVVRVDDLDWVTYLSVLYTNKALMKVVSKVKLEWVQERLSLFKKLATANLDGSYGSNKSGSNILDNMNEDSDKVNSMIADAQKVKDQDDEKKRKRLEAIEAARQRALARKSVTNED